MKLRDTKYLDAAMFASFLFTLIVPLNLVVSPTFAKSLTLTKVIIPAFDQDESTWQRIHTNDDEFSILMPMRPPVFVKANQNLGANRVSVSMERVVKGYQDGLVFIVKMYETSNPKGLLNDYFNIFHRTQGDKHETSINGFEGIQYLWKDDAVYDNIQVFAAKRRVYVIEVAGRSKANPAINRFLSSLKLGSTGSEPIDDSSKISNPSSPNNSSENSTPVTDSVFDKSEVTHPAVSLYLPIPVRPKGYKGTVKLKMVLSSSGEIADISITPKLDNRINQYFTELAKSIIFLPAEKDGHPVSQNSEVTFNFQ